MRACDGRCPVSRRRRDGTGAIVRAIREQGDRIVAAIRDTSAEQTASRAAMAEDIVKKGAIFVRASLEAMDAMRSAANDTEPPPDSSPRK